MPAVLITVIASDMVNLMLPAIGAEFGASEAELAWVVTGFLLMFSIGIPFYGRVSDRVSLRRLFGFALLTYAAGSLVCALAPNLLVLVTGRIVMGAGAAALPVLSIIAVTRLLPANKRGLGIGVVSAATGVGTAAGPAIGGVIGQFLGWPALFWLMLVVALALLPAALRVLPGEPPAGVGRFDLAGGILLGLGAGLFLFGMTQAQVAGFAAPSSWASLVVAVAAIALFGWRTVRVALPFVPPSLFTNSNGGDQHGSRGGVDECGGPGEWVLGVSGVHGGELPAVIATADELGIMPGHRLQVGEQGSRAGEDERSGEPHGRVPFQ